MGWRWHPSTHSIILQSAAMPTFLPLHCSALYAQVSVLQEIQDISKNVTTVASRASPKTIDEGIIGIVSTVFIVMGSLWSMV
jgi:2-methylaconitate cis-trans-isomerase PrpF